ncbi:hypothetical protein NM688_g4497 [Phlebia brevispora]|uniref:Uncharacterized protein n=1 Tax=Phlebia brevispora TaxID=194682 RepID=A0ACC1T2S1_9APHY|nr:hypothetical protein NM688_g4497 [Phlebia brevispora]
MVQLPDTGSFPGCLQDTLPTIHPLLGGTQQHLLQGQTFQLGMQPSAADTVLEFASPTVLIPQGPLHSTEAVEEFFFIEDARHTTTTASRSSLSLTDTCSVEATGITNMSIDLLATSMGNISLERKHERPSSPLLAGMQDSEGPRKRSKMKRTHEAPRIRTSTRNHSTNIGDNATATANAALGEPTIQAGHYLRSVLRKEIRSLGDLCSAWGLHLQPSTFRRSDMHGGDSHGFDEPAHGELVYPQAF